MIVKGRVDVASDLRVMPCAEKTSVLCLEGDLH